MDEDFRNRKRQLMASRFYYAGLSLLITEGWLETVSFPPETASLHQSLKDSSNRAVHLGTCWAEHVMNAASFGKPEPVTFTTMFVPTLRGTSALDRIHQYLALFQEDPATEDNGDTSEGHMFWMPIVIKAMVGVVLGESVKDLFVASLESTSSVSPTKRERQVAFQGYKGQFMDAVHNHPVMKLQVVFDVSRYVFDFLNAAVEVWIREENDPIKAARDEFESLLGIQGL